MSIKIFKQEEGIAREISESYSVLNLVTAKDSDKLSVAISIAKDHKEVTKTTSDRIYFVLEGEIQANNLVAKEGEVVFVPANTEYEFKGAFKAVLINSPPFRKTDEKISKL